MILTKTMVNTFTTKQNTPGLLNRLKIGTLLMLLVSLFQVSAQDVTVTGTVLDAEENSPLPGVTILVKGTSTGTITDIDGNYTIKASADDVLLFSFIGFQSQEINVGSQRVISISMETDMTSLDEVVVIGYGTQLKKVVTAATTQVTGEELMKRNTTNAFQAMQGQAAGVSIRSGSGQPGDGLRVVIRGLGTISNSEPLYVVDGVQTGDIKYLNNADIQSIDVLKDAASAAIYGSRAANGVVLITTKKGRAGEGSITFDGYYGVQNLAKKLDMLDAREYAQIINEQHLNSNGSINALPFSVSDLPAYTTAGSANTDWIDEMFVKNAITKNYSIGLNGGSDRTIYSVSFSYTGQEGIMGGSKLSNYDRYGARINTENTFYNGKLKVGENLTYTYVDKNGVATGNQYYNTLRSALNVSPLLPVYDDNGDFFNTADESILDQNGEEYWNNTEANPYALMVLNNQNARNEQKLFANVFAELEIIKNLKFRSSIGIDHYADEYRAYTPEYQLSIYAITNYDRVTQSMKRTRTMQFDNTLNYSRSFGSQSIDIMVGTSTREYQGSWMEAANSALSFNDFDHAWLNNATNQEYQLLNIKGAPEDADKLLSYFGRIQYDYKKKYLLNATFRADGSSKFAPGNQWGFFPSVSAGWVISNEAFLSSVSSINFLKLRASFGTNGNQGISPFQFLAPISFQNATYNFGNAEAVNTPGAFPERLSNPDVKWETSEQIDFGFDARVLGNKFLIAFDWYKKSTIDWLIEAPILATGGADAPSINGGDVLNTGFELELTFENSVGDLNYSISANGAYNKNRVRDIPTNDQIVHGAANSLYANSSEFYRAQAGHPIGFFWGYETDGLFQNNGEVASYTDGEGEMIQPNAKPGDVRYVDQNGDGVINLEDKVEIGNPNPPLSFGLTISADFRGFDFTMMTYGVAGNEIVQSYRDHSGKFNNYTTDILDRWTGEGTSTRIPRVTNGNINYQFSDLFVQDGSYYRIGNVTLGYDFTKLVKLDKVDKFRLFLSANNLYTFTKYTGMDPDVGYGLDNGDQDKFSSGIDLGFYPNPRTLMVGASVKF